MQSDRRGSVAKPDEVTLTDPDLRRRLLHLMTRAQMDRDVVQEFPRIGGGHGSEKEVVRGDQEGAAVRRVRGILRNDLRQHVIAGVGGWGTLVLLYPIPGQRIPQAEVVIGVAVIGDGS